VPLVLEEASDHEDDKSSSPPAAPEGAPSDKKRQRQAPAELKRKRQRQEDSATPAKNRRPLQKLHEMSHGEQAEAFAQWFRQECEAQGESELELAADSAEIPGLSLQNGEGMPNKSAESLAGFVKTIAGEWRSLKDPKKGQVKSPRVLVLASGARRCVQFVPGLRRTFGGPVLKLFAKHFKPKDQEKALRKKKWICAVGTPGRVLALAESGALNFSNTKVLVLDVQPDSKSFNLLEHAGEDIFKLLRGHARAASDESSEQQRSIRLGLF